MANITSYTKKVLLPLFAAAFFVLNVGVVQAGGGRVELNGESGVAGTKAAEVKAKIFADDANTQPAVGRQGSFSFTNAQSGQSCTTSNQTSNSAGEIFGSCTSSSTGQFVITFTTDGEEPRTLAISFSAPPSPTPSPSPSSSPSPSPQTVSGSYKLETSHSNISFTNQVDTGYGINVTLKDSSNNQVIVKQSDIEYNWVSNDSSIVQITNANAYCVAPVESPCPRTNGQLRGFKPGTTTIKVTARKGGQQIAEVSTTVTITQTTTGQSYYTASASPSPSPSPTVTPSPTATPAPTPSASPKASLLPSPSPTASPTVQPSATVSAALSDDEAGGAASQNAATTTTASPKPSPSTKGNSTQDSRSGGEVLAWTAVVIGVLSGIFLPVGWYVVGNSPELKGKLSQLFHRNTQKN